MHERHGPAFRCYFFGRHVVVVDLDVYERSLAKLDTSARFVPLWPTGFQRLLGNNALQFLHAGSGPRGSRHRRLKRKVLDALSPAELRHFLPRIEAIIREEFECMADETAATGQCALMPHTMRMVKRVILELVLGPGAMRPEDYLKDTSKTLMDGMIAAPVNLGRFSAYGRAMAVRRSYQRDVERQLSKALAQVAGKCSSHEEDACDSVDNKAGYTFSTNRGDAERDSRTMLSRLTRECEHGPGLSTQEMQDMLISLLFGGSLTTAETMQWLLFELSHCHEWRDQVREEHLSLAAKAAAAGGLATAWGTSPPEGSRTPCPLSLWACYETLRLHCPVDVQLRSVEESVDLGEGLGTIPAGWWVAVHITERGLRLGPAFDPGRWRGRAAASEVTAFGLGPHFCVGRQLALWELQVFLHVWLTDYEVQVLGGETYHLTGMQRFRDGLPVAVRRRDRWPGASVLGA